MITYTLTCTLTSPQAGNFLELNNDSMHSARWLAEGVGSPLVSAPLPSLPPSRFDPSPAPGPHANLNSDAKP